jgi:cytochrome P450
MFLFTIGLPVEDGAMFTEWVEALFLGFFGGPDPTPAATAINGYFSAAIAERKANPGDPELDFVSRLLRPEVVGEWLTEADLLLVCLTLMTAGLDTTRAALGYIFQHLAGDDELRHRLTAHPELWPRAVEEFMRLYPLVIQDGRLVMTDIDFHGLSLKKGDVLWLGIGSANRDPRKFPNPDVFDMDRPDINHHLGFAAGPHRCLGMHLARHELVIALQEWHKRIPDYTIAEGTELRERGGQLTLMTLPLRWTSPGGGSS